MSEQPSALMAIIEALRRQRESDNEKDLLPVQQQLPILDYENLSNQLDAQRAEHYRGLEAERAARRALDQRLQQNVDNYNLSASVLGSPPLPAAQSNQQPPLDDEITIYGDFAGLDPATNQRYDALARFAPLIPIQENDSPRVPLERAPPRAFAQAPAAPLNVPRDPGARPTLPQSLPITRAPMPQPAPTPGFQPQQPAIMPVNGPVGPGGVLPTPPLNIPREVLMPQLQQVPQPQQMAAGGQPGRPFGGGNVNPQLAALIPQLAPSLPPGPAPNPLTQQLTALNFPPEPQTQRPQPQPQPQRPPARQPRDVYSPDENDPGMHDPTLPVATNVHGRTQSDILNRQQLQMLQQSPGPPLEPRAAPKPAPVPAGIPPTATPQLPTPAPQLGEKPPEDVKSALLDELKRLSRGGWMTPQSGIQ